MRDTKLTVRCMAVQKENQWHALCLEYCLASQADTFEAARKSLDTMICEYLYDALVGEDQDYADQLLNHRKAPIKDWIKYYSVSFLLNIGAIKNEIHRIFIEPIPLTPRNCNQL